MNIISGKRIHGILFDLWNTLIFTDAVPGPMVTLAAAFGLDSRPDWRQVLEQAMMTRRLPGIGAAIDEIRVLVGREPGSGWTRRDLMLMWGAATNQNRIYPDALPALRRLGRNGGMGLTLGIVSNTQSFDLDLIRREGLDHLFDAICLSCDLGMLKPEPEIYRHAAGLMGIPADRILMVGDSIRDDVAGPVRAGMRGLLLDRSGCDVTGTPAIRSLSDLPALIASWRV